MLLIANFRRFKPVNTCPFFASERGFPAFTFRKDDDKSCGERLKMKHGLIAGRAAQQYNRKHREGAFWPDRYHATAIESGEHLLRWVDASLKAIGAKRDSRWTARVAVGGRFFVERIKTDIPGDCRPGGSRWLISVLSP